MGKKDNNDPILPTTTKRPSEVEIPNCYLVKGHMTIPTGEGKDNLNRKEILNLMEKKITTGWYSYSKTAFCRVDLYSSGKRGNFE